MLKKFKAKLVGMGPGGAWVCLTMPFSAEKEFGSKARIAVKGTINGFPFRTSIFPMGDGKHSMMVNKELRAGAKAEAGQTVSVEIGPDAAPREVTVPPELEKALGKKPVLKKFFEQLSYTHRKDFVMWVKEAKRPETRAARVERTLGMLASKLTLGKIQKERYQHNKAEHS